MPGTSDVIYLYDGSFEGLLCCVHESVYTHELPVDIQPEEAAQPTLFRQKYIAADEEKAARVYDSIPRKISPDAAALVQCVFLSCMPMLAARQNLLNEAHLLKEFLRFSDYDGALAATITPKNYVLPFLKEHFCSRLMNETFLIFDRTHKAALVWQDRKARIISLDTLELPPATAEELRYRVLWKRFYKTIAIAARENPRCRMTHCPKRYWENMLEMEDELRRTPDSLDALPAAAPALLPQKEGHYGAQYSFPRLP